MGFSTVQAEKFRERLLALGPPPEVIERFDQLLFESGQNWRFIFDSGEVWCPEDTLEDLLKDAARAANWTRPWEPDGVSLSFRAKKIAHDHPEYSADVGGENTPATEQAYRRGVVHGLGRAMDILGVDLNSSHPVARETMKVWQWRSAEMHNRDTLAWGSFVEPEYPCLVRSTLRRSGLPPNLRWNVLGRDGRKCVVCGISASQGAVLEVDHIVSVAEGGTDEMANLRTLCFDCNRGKGAISDAFA